MGLSHSPGIVTDGLVYMIDPGNTRGNPQFAYGTICGTANEGGNLTLTAPAGAVFDQINYASYGTPDGTCGLYTNGACHATGSTSIVSTYLLNNNTGTIPATNGVFGDPCGGTYKRLYVEARYKYTSSANLTGVINNSFLVNGIGTTTDNVGSFYFDGTNDYISVPAITQNNNATTFTWMVWAKRSTSSSLITLIQNTGLENDIGLELWSDGNIYFEVGNGLNSYGSLSNNSTAWQHIAMSYDGNGLGNSGKLKAYVNGVQQSLSYTQTIPNTSGSGTTLYIGNTGPNTGANSNLYSAGYISAFQSYSKSLNDAEIRQNFNATRKRYGI